MTRPRSDITTEVRYRLLVQAVTDYAIYMLDPDGVIVSWNPGAHRLKGYSEEEILGQHFSLFYPEEEVRAGMPARTLAIATHEGRFISEAWRVRKGGERFWASVVVDPILSPDGALLGFAKVTRDLTERKAAEEALRRSEEQFRLLVQGVTDYAIYMLDTSGVVTNWNAGAQRIKGYAPEDAIGLHFSRFYRAEERQAGAPQAALDRARTGGRFENEGWRVRQDGTEFWAHVIIDPIFDADGRHIGYAKVTRDITEKRAAAAELERARESLFQSQKLDAIGQLTGGIAHDFNNLLMVVLSSLALAQRRLPDDEKLQKLVDNAVAGARRGVSLTKRLLAFARRQDLDPTRVDVAELVKDMREMLERTLGPIITIAMDFEPGLPPVYIDANQLELALLNLAVNARDAMPEGGHLTISARTQPTDPQHAPSPLAPSLYLAVSDTGAGMSPDTLDHAMEPFFTTKGVGKGTGLGLAMVHGLALQSGGGFTLRSIEGQGTTAELWLPIAGAGVGTEAAQAMPEPAALPPYVPPPTAVRSLRVLAVDDDALVLGGTVAMLEELGHYAVTAASGAEALEILARDAGIDLLITDHVMPGMRGADLADAARSQCAGLPIILASGFAELPPNRPALEQRLAKPFTQDELATAIRLALEHGEAPRRAP